MSAPLILAVPSKGRLQQNAESFFARSGLELVKPRGPRDYRGAIAGFDGVEVAYLSAAEITTQLALGAVHLGVTGEDLVREMIPDADREVVFIDQLGFGFANVAVAGNWRQSGKSTYERRHGNLIPETPVREVEPPKKT